MIKSIKKCISIILAMVLVLSMVGCSESTSKKTAELSIYYIDTSGTKLNTEEFKTKETVDNKIINNLLEKLSQNGSKKRNKRTIPKNVIINGFSLADGIITVDFNEAYNDIKNEQEIFVRAGLVLTLIQLSAVKGIQITVDGKPFEKIGDKALGVMDASSFVSSLRGDDNIFAKGDFILYFANEDGNSLKRYNLKEANYGSMSKEEFIVRTLIDGPKKRGYTETFSESVKVNSVMTSENICYVDFDSTFLNQQSEVSDEMVIYSLVNSLSELNEVHKVQITVNGSTDNMYHRMIDLSEPFMRNLDLVKE